MQTKLNQKYPNLARVVNVGQGASSTAVPARGCGLDKIKHVIAAKPDTVFIEYGMNDCYLPYKISATQSEKNLNTIIDGILKADPNVEIILQTMNSCKDYKEKHPTWLHASTRPELASYYEIYRKVARERKFLLIDHYPNWLKIMNESPELFDACVPDRIHPNAKGAEEVIVPTLIKAIGL